MYDLDRVKYELEKLGMNTDYQNTFDYQNNILLDTYELAKVFYNTLENQNHSGLSHSCVMNLFKRLVIDEDTASPLTNDKSEWIQSTYNSNRYSSKRLYGAVSDDGLKTYYKLSDKDRVHYPVKQL